jgi:asparagine synthase (glutamine-hydrolysing)
MCGFAGSISWDDRFGISRDALMRMSACVAHRGPDGQGTWFDEGDISRGKPQVLLAHRRLAVIDPDPRANQPFSDARGRQLVYNGEIYNFRELRAELSALKPQYQWRTTCDTEVLLVAYDAWGDKCCQKFDGMFAFAIWDPTDGSLFLARDRTGQKPLYLAMGQSSASECGVGAIAFASELSALRALSWVDATVDPRAVGHYLRWGYVPSPMTIYKGCEKLPPAHSMRVRGRGIEVVRYVDVNQPNAIREEASPGRIRELVSDAVRRQLVSDVPLGCFLSGGIDSSIIALTMKQAVSQGQEVLTFSIGFDDPRYDESRFANEVAHHLGTKHQTFIVRPDAAEDLPKLAAVFAEPFADSSALPTYWLSRETRRHVTVALSGDGGDELFGGYDRYRALLMGESFRSMPPGLRQIALSKIWDRLLAGKHPKSRTARLKRLLATLHLPAAQRYDAYMRYLDEPTAASLFPDPDALESRDWLTGQFESLACGQDAALAAMALDRVTYLPEDLHTKVDRASMLQALEVRAPFMDAALLRFCAGLTTQELFGTRGRAGAFMQSPLLSPGKRLLRQAFAGDLPESVFKRRKMGFAIPIGQWFRSDLRELLQDALGSKNAFASDYLDRATVQRLVDEHQSGSAEHGQRLYALLMLELWWKQAREG